MVKKLLPWILVALVVGLAWRFWPRAADIEAAVFEGGGESGSDAAVSRKALVPNGAAVETPVRPAAFSAQEVRDPAPPAEAAALLSAVPAAAGARALDRWHREGSGTWRPLAGEEDAAEALRAFAGVWEGRGAAYAAQLRIDVPRCLGEEFAGYAKAFAERSVGGLDDALQAASRRGPAWMAWTEALVIEALGAQQDLVAGAALGRLLEEMAADAYPRPRILALGDWTARLRARVRAWAPFKEYEVVSGDSLDLICRKFRKEGLKLRFGWLMEVNGRSSDRIRLGETLRIPTAPLRVLALRGQCLVALYCGSIPIHLFEASYGRPGEETPLGRFTLQDFLVEPVDWGLNPPVPYGHPAHRLGTRWMGFAEDRAYGIHGNNCADDVGRFESAGCIRMRNGEVEALFDLLPEGCEVEVRG